NVGQANYSAAKAGVAALTMIAARELERYGVRVNAIAPIAATRLTSSVMSDTAKERFDPANVSPLVVYLLSQEAREVNGRIFLVGADGVVTVDPPRPIAGGRTEDGQWTPQALAAVVPGIVAQLPPSQTSLDAAKFMADAPITATAGSEG
ncbi:MAG TPA: SDR family oxidoreductase, partial [Acidocella sp.]|nr:SDR family oxidoreductase [Acidocella sp.]